MSSRSKSTLFLIEQLIVIAVFAICAAACIRILATAYNYANTARDTCNALLAAESGAESFKSAAGDLGKVAEILDGKTVTIEGYESVIVYFDKEWQACGEDDAHFELRLISDSQSTESGQVTTGELSVEKITGEELVTIPIAARADG